MPDEAREWAEVRAAAICAVREALRTTRAAEALADAVLAVCDEEAVSRMADEFVNETRIKGMDFRNGAHMDLVSSETLVANWVAAARGWFDEHPAPNYTETEVSFDDDKMAMEAKIAGEFERYVFILQRVGPGKLTPHEARKKAEAEVERLTDENAILKGLLEHDGA